MTPKPMTTDELLRMVRQDCMWAIRDVGTKAWIGDTNVDEVQDLVWDRHSHVIDVSKMDAVIVIPAAAFTPQGDEQ